MIKIGICYIAKFAKVTMPVRIESRKDNGVWLSRSLTHGRIVFVRNEAQLLRECSESDLSELAKTVLPNRRSKKPAPAPKMPVETVQAAQNRKVKRRRPSVPEFGLTLVEAAYRILRQSQKPLTSQEIVDLAYKRKMHRSNGATPQNTLNAAIIRDLKANGEQSRFVKVGRGMFTAR